MPRHGTAYHYNLGCRCEECRGAALAKRREQRRLGREQQRESYKRELATARALKERYRGNCIECGAPTTGSLGPGLAPERCIPCTNKIIGRNRRGTGPTIGTVLEFLESGPARYSEIRRVLNGNANLTSEVMNRLMRYGLVERPSRGLYRLPS